MAFPEKTWTPPEKGRELPRSGFSTFNPHDPTKGDLAALNEALEKAGWSFRYFHGSDHFAAHHMKHGPVWGRDSADRALKCVEAMP